jgi:hypothetical protein
VALDAAGLVDLVESGKHALAHPLAKRGGWPVESGRLSENDFVGADAALRLGRER